MLSESQSIIYKEFSWDDRGVLGATIDDIDRNAIDYFLQRSIKAGRMDEEEANAPTEHVLRNLGDEVILKLSERQELMKAIIKSNPTITAKQMSETLSVTARTVERDLAIMQKAGIIRHEGANKLVLG